MTRSLSPALLLAASALALGCALPVEDFQPPPADDAGAPAEEAAIDSGAETATVPVGNGDAVTRRDNEKEKKKPK